ncbi:MAG: hypothetical protein ACK4L7_11860, partial [Flavobacteriales bacterium]
MTVAGAATVLGLSIVKFLFAAGASYALGHTYWETVALLAIGGGAGTAAFYLLGARLLDLLRLRALRRRMARMAKGLPPKPSFTRTNRFIVRSKRGYGLIGLAIMPPILSVPITALVAAKYFRHDRRT